MAPPARSPRRLKLVLDAHHSPMAAATLRTEGHDVKAAATEPSLARLEDEELLAFAAREGRALVTENAEDFDRIVRAMSAHGEHHAGVIFTSPRRYHRGSAAYPGNLIAALRTLLDEPPPNQTDWIHWLP
ncbi:MAG: DUF5615 family PIN-like protein [Acidimicrobiia bacterium]